MSCCHYEGYGVGEGGDEKWGAFVRDGDDMGLETLNGAWSGRWLGPRSPWLLSTR